MWCAKNMSLPTTFPFLTSPSPSLSFPISISLSPLLDLSVFRQKPGWAPTGWFKTNTTPVSCPLRKSIIMILIELTPWLLPLGRIFGWRPVFYQYIYDDEEICVKDNGTKALARRQLCVKRILYIVWEWTTRASTEGRSIEYYFGTKIEWKLSNEALGFVVFSGAHDVVAMD